MVNRLPSWIFLSLAMLLMGIALMPLVRAAIGIDTEIQMSFLTVISLLIAGLMCGLTAMLLLVRRQPKLKTHLTQTQWIAAFYRSSAAQLSGLLLPLGHTA